MCCEKKIHQDITPITALFSCFCIDPILEKQTKHRIAHVLIVGDDDSAIRLQYYNLAILKQESTITREDIPV